MATCFCVFMYAIIRPADVEVNLKLHCAHLAQSPILNNYNYYRKMYVK
jgi:hypothetical protein